MEQEQSAINREKIFQYVQKTYAAAPVYKWAKYPNYAVLQHGSNKKWFAVVMDVPKAKLKLAGEGAADILNVKCDPIMVGSLRTMPGILPAYHMDKCNWVSIVLDGSVPPETICSLIDFSYQLTGSKSKSSKKEIEP